VNSAQGSLRGVFIRGCAVLIVVSLVGAIAAAFQGPDWLAPAEFGVAPARVDASTFSTAWPIKHVIFLVKENRTFDNMFGRYPGVEGVRQGLDKGEVRPLTRTPDSLPNDIKHCYPCALEAWNDGAMDGFARDPVADLYAYTQMARGDAPNYWRWAHRFVLADNFFASAQGPSFPNHLYSIAATSGGTHDNPVQSPGELKRRHDETGLFKSWGCSSPKDAYVEVTDSEGVVERVPPCFDFQTEGDLLNGADIPWVYYSPTPYQNGYLWSAYDAVRHVREDPAEWQAHVFPVDSLVDHIHQGLLPPVTWVTPRFESSEHPEYSFCQGENWTTEVVNAVMTSDMWKDTAIFITWDDYGGFYDHVPPPQVDDFGFGFRVPLLILSPYARAGYVDHTLGEFSSVLRFIEDNWGLNQLTLRDTNADNLTQAFDFTQEPQEPDPLPLRECPPFDPPG
jgi:phospholipase C